MSKASVFLIFVLSVYNSWGQGCSDAGFCTMGAMKPDQQYSRNVSIKLRSVEINAYRGTTTLTPIIYVLTADMTFAITDLLFLQAKVPYQHVEGSLGETSGLSDISLSLTRNIFTTSKGSLNATIGTKIPTNKSDLKGNKQEFGLGQDLPMYYQTSLGSYDLIAGASWINDKWLFATGVQAALTENENDFKWSEWPDYPDQSYIERYPRATNLKRGIDVMMRVERNFRFTNFNVSVGLLPIYRVTQDERTNLTTGEREKVEGTTGLALSALVGGGYSFNVNNGLKCMLGMKLMDRDVNPDGLTRGVVMNLSYVYRF